MPPAWSIQRCFPSPTCARGQTTGTIRQSSLTASARACACNGQRKTVVVGERTMRINAGHGIAEALRLEWYRGALRCVGPHRRAGRRVSGRRHEPSRHAVDDEATPRRCCWSCRIRSTRR